MMESRNLLEVKIEEVKKNFLRIVEGEDLLIISHFDTDGISSAAIMVETLNRLDQQFSLKIKKSLNKKFIHNLPKDKNILLLDLGSGNLNDLREANLKKVFIIDHHEVVDEIPENVEIINPELCEKQKISASSLTYLFSKSINEKNIDLAKIAILGMIGDQLEKEIGKWNNEILKESQIQKKRGLLLYPSTRPINRVLEYSSNPFIPGVTGDIKGVLELLREAGLKPERGKYKNLIDLTEKEMEKLVTSIILRMPQKKNRDFLGDLYLTKFYGKIEDARELSAKINACSRNGNPEIAIAFCLEKQFAKKKIESIHAKYKQSLISGLKYAQECKKIEGEEYVIINAGEEIKDTMIGTITSILANSAIYPKGKIIVSLSKDTITQTIKISARNVGKKGRNVRRILSEILSSLEGEVGGHEFAAGGTVHSEKEDELLEKIKEFFEMEVIRIAE